MLDSRALTVRHRVLLVAGRGRRPRVRKRWRREAGRAVGAVETRRRAIGGRAERSWRLPKGESAGQHCTGETGARECGGAKLRLLRLRLRLTSWLAGLLLRLLVLRRAEHEGGLLRGGAAGLLRLRRRLLRLLRVLLLREQALLREARQHAIWRHLRQGTRSDVLGAVANVYTLPRAAMPQQ